jgi:lysophospholipase L1-like esterase
VIDRASFVRSFAAALALPPQPSVIPQTDVTRPFNVLILGDSIAWGQGLLPKHRWRDLLVDRLSTTLKREVDQIAPQIHSGAVIGIGDRNEIDLPGLYAPDVYAPGQEKPSLLDKGEYAGELPSTTPTVLAQLDTLEALDPDVPIDLVVVSAGINDVRIARFLDPFASPRFIDDLIELHCRLHLTVLLDRIRVRCVDGNPACKVVVLSYFQMISNDSVDVPSVYDFVSAIFTAPPRTASERRGRRVLAGVAEAEEVIAQPPVVTGPAPPRKLPDLINRIVDAAARFYRASEAAIDRAVSDANRAPFSPAFVHVTPHIGPAQALYVVPRSASSLWAAVIGGHKPPVPTDEVAQYREPLCINLYGPKGPSLNECDIASIGHPDIAGASEGYFDAIWAAISPMLQAQSSQ